MNEIIKIEHREGIETVNARELHGFLGSGTRFNDWIQRRIAKYGFIENQDYISVTQKRVSGNNADSVEYFISIDMAKELSMVENNERGREARQYFILMEKRAKALTSPQLTEEELVLKAMELQKKKIEQLSIKAQIADELSMTEGLFLPSMVGKMIAGEPINFIKWLCDEGIMFHKGKEKRLVPKSPYDHKEKGYFRIKTTRYHGDKTTVQTYFTSRGVCWIQGRYLKKNGLLQLDYARGLIA